MLELGGRTDEAVAAVERAIALYERTGNLAMAGHVRARLDGLVARPAHLSD